ncbi:MAG: hypothetical protein A3F72_12985 [Bacteroidetes bacterium RIFCSPLOWO2_12_FULL_35_15]|nr:MAG: hypothetical protein A3F72_12980 [Bacteroidetes bacterium RIFCSPLOWO2_12_FULL_35_15]OFY83533.1 MAG: hypothetical protein A3F72_12985 [Bacteroidetes bacterium RIFCSPLOWO2_12_FULL_35_15]
MNFGRFFNKLAIAVIVIIIVGWLINLALHKLENNRLEKNERDEKLAKGTCVFDKVDLDSLVISKWEKTFKPILSVTDFKKYFNDELLNVKLNDTLQDVQTIKIDNSDFSFHNIGQNIFVNAINIDKTSQFTFNVKEKLNVTPDYDLDNFKEQFPKSFSCRENVSTSTKIEEFALRLDNSNKASELQFIILYFNRADNLCLVEFYYQE